MANGSPMLDPCNQAPLPVAQFRAMFPAFGDATVYPDPTVQIWLGLAPVDPCLWGEWYQLGQGLWTAHELMKIASPQAIAGGSGSAPIGPQSSKSVGPVSVSYDNSLGEEEGAGQYNSTIYGREFIHYARLVGMGPWQIGPASIPPYGVTDPWLGPPPIPGWFG